MSFHLFSFRFFHIKRNNKMYFKVFKTMITMTAILLNHVWMKMKSWFMPEHTQQQLLEQDPTSTSISPTVRPSWYINLTRTLSNQQNWEFLCSGDTRRDWMWSSLQQDWLPGTSRNQEMESARKKRTQPLRFILINLGMDRSYLLLLCPQNHSSDHYLQ